VSTESPERPSRLEQEVREILERTEAQRSPMEHISDSVDHTRAEAQQRLQRPAPFPARSKYLTPDILRLVGALALALVAVLLSGISNLLATVAAIASLIVFFSLWFPSIRSSTTHRPRWRGRDLN
jgi:hypothetical protein